MARQSLALEPLSSAHAPVSTARAQLQYVYNNVLLSPDATECSESIKEECFRMCTKHVSYCRINGGMLYSGFAAASGGKEHIPWGWHSIENPENLRNFVLSKFLALIARGDCSLNNCI